MTTHRRATAGVNMRGADEASGSLFSYVDLEARIPARHPLRKIRQVVDDALASLDAEFSALTEGLQDELLAHANLLATFGPQLGRPMVDMLKGSKHANMKELRFSWNGEVWRVAFAFDPQRHAVLLVGGDKGGADQRRFYKRLLSVADTRYDEHLNVKGV